jgi:hypothetical protein
LQNENQADHKGAVKMLRKDREAARTAWLDSLPEVERLIAEESDFLKFQDFQGRFLDFHALRHTFITNVV